jgi:hypothetical protein
MLSLNGGATDIKVIQNFGAGVIQLSFLSPRAGSLDEVGCSCIILLGSKDFMGSCP